MSADFLDSNVFIYLFDDVDERKRSAARRSRPSIPLSALLLRFARRGGRVGRWVHALGERRPPPGPVDPWPDGGRSLSLSSMRMIRPGASDRDADDLPVTGPRRDVGQRGLGPLPTWSRAQRCSPEPMISMVVRASVPYSDVAALALAAIERKPVTFEARFVRGQVHVSDVLIRPSGAQLAVAVTVLADLAWPLPRVRGVLDFAATPVYDGETQALRLSDVSLTADVDHVLARAAFAFKRSEIVDALDAVSLDVEPWLRDLRDRLNASLSGSGLAPGVALRGHVETMRVDDILIAEELVVVASATGRLRATVDPPAVD